MHKRILWLILLSLLWSGVVFAQDDTDAFSEGYTFVDGTVFNYPADFLIYSEDYDSLFLANDQIDMFFFIVYERTILSQELNDLPTILRWYLPEEIDYEAGDEDAITLGERDGISFSYEVDSSPDFDRELYLVPVGDNGSVAVVRVQPNIENDVEALEDDDRDLALNIIETLSFVDLRGDLSTVLGNSITFDGQWMIEYPDDWLANGVAQTLQRGEATTIAVSAYSPEEIMALDLKDDPIELLYYDLFAPADTTISFDPEGVSFVNVRGLEGVRYSLLDTVDDSTIQRVYFLAPLPDGWVLAMDITTPVGTAILQDTTVQDMIQTVRLAGTLPPIAMITMENAFILPGIGQINFPDFWTVRETESGGVSMSTIDINVFLFAFDAITAADAGYTDNLGVALLDIVDPLDGSVVINPDDVIVTTLQNGNPVAEASYIETSDSGRSYTREIRLIQLDNGAVVFVGVIPQPGIDEIPEASLIETIAILNTLVP
ncbi:MAG: hypothetical protein AAFR81_20740 [Chloroflexota bacterium]